MNFTRRDFLKALSLGVVAVATFRLPEARAQTEMDLLVDDLNDAVGNHLFGYNDEQTREAITKAMNDYLQNLKERRALQDYLVICDETNNTPTVINKNELTADIYLKPSRSVNFINLKVHATSQGVGFEEVLGETTKSINTVLRRADLRKIA